MPRLWGSKIKPVPKPTVLFSIQCFLLIKFLQKKTSIPYYEEMKLKVSTNFFILHKTEKNYGVFKVDFS